jgi:hypothetical protein
VTDQWRPYWPVDPLQDILEEQRRLRELMDPPSLRGLRQVLENLADLETGAGAEKRASDVSIRVRSP